MGGPCAKNGFAALSFLSSETTTNGSKDKEILSEKLKLHMRVTIVFVTQLSQVFVQDGAPCHRAKVTNSFLEDNKIELLKWPGNSQELNPRENLWTNVKNNGLEKITCCRVGKVDERSLDEKISHEYFQNPIDSMPKRMKVVIKVREGNIEG